MLLSSRTDLSFDIRNRQHPDYHSEVEKSNQKMTRFVIKNRFKSMHCGNLSPFHIYVKKKIMWPATGPVCLIRDQDGF